MAPSTETSSDEQTNCVPGAIPNQLTKMRCDTPQMRTRHSRRCCCRNAAISRRTLKQWSRETWAIIQTGFQVGEGERKRETEREEATIIMIIVIIIINEWRTGVYKKGPTMALSSP